MGVCVVEKKLIVSLATDSILSASLTAFGDYPRRQNAIFFFWGGGWE